MNGKFKKYKSAGFSVIESLIGLSILSIAIATTIGASRYLYSLQHALDSKTADVHFKRITNLLVYGTCDSLLDDTYIGGAYSNSPDTDITRDDNGMPEIKTRQPQINLATNTVIPDQYDYNILYTAKNNNVKYKNQPAKTLLDNDKIYIESMGLEADPHLTQYTVLKVVFVSKRSRGLSISSKNPVSASSTTSSSASVAAAGLPKKSKFERFLRLYLNVDPSTRKITSCSLQPRNCKAEEKTIELNREEIGNTLVNCSKIPSCQSAETDLTFTLVSKNHGNSIEIEDIVNDCCVCNVRFLCQNSQWREDITCLKRNKRYD